MVIVLRSLLVLEVVPLTTVGMIPEDVEFNGGRPCSLLVLAG